MNNTDRTMCFISLLLGSVCILIASVATALEGFMTIYLLPFCLATVLWIVLAVLIAVDWSREDTMASYGKESNAVGTAFSLRQKRGEK